MIMSADAIQCPWTMMIHFQYTAAADAAMMRTWSAFRICHPWEEYGLKPLQTLHHRSPAFPADVSVGSYH